MPGLGVSLAPSVRLQFAGSQTWLTRLHNVEGRHVAHETLPCALTYNVQAQFVAQLIPQCVVWVVAAAHRIKVEALHKADVLQKVNKSRASRGVDMHNATKQGWEQLWCASDIASGWGSWSAGSQTASCWTSRSPLSHPPTCTMLSRLTVLPRRWSCSCRFTPERMKRAGAC